MLGFTFASRRLRRNLGKTLSERVLFVFSGRPRSKSAVSAKLGRPELLELPARTAGVSRNARLYVWEPSSATKSREIAPERVS